MSVDRLTQSISMAKRKKTNLAVCFLDLDDFKQVNDKHGHMIGDLLLLASSKCMQKSIRDVDTLARLGGDEFALILPDIKKEQDVLAILKRIVDCFAAGFLIENIQFKVTLSIGIALYPKDGDKELIKKADMVMYYAKKTWQK